MKMKISSAQTAKLKDADFYNANGPTAYDLSRLQWQNFGGYNAVAPAAGGSAPASKMRQINKTLRFVITNSSSTTQTVTLFNVLSGGTSPTFADNVSVVARDTTYTRVLNGIQASNGFKIKGLKYLVRDQAAQFNNAFSIGTRDFLGATKSEPYNIQNCTTAMNNNALELDDMDFEANIKVETYWEIDVNGTDSVATTGEQITLICSIAGYLDQSDMLDLRPVLQVNESGPNDGLPSMTTTLVINPGVMTPPVPGSSVPTSKGGLFK